jgi:hypothetical protein
MRLGIPVLLALFVSVAAAQTPMPLPRPAVPEPQPKPAVAAAPSRNMLARELFGQARLPAPMSALAI